jgi:DNA-directed RNA polymerase I, II, and III subunit RPABC2
MFEENDEEYNASNDVDFSDDEEVSDQFQDDENKDDEKPSFKIISFDDIRENILKTPKKTIPFLTRFEKARIIGVRLQQLAYGAKPRIDTTNLRSMNEIVEQELIQRKIPFIIRRPLPNGTFEDWKMEEFETI